MSAHSNFRDILLPQVKAKICKITWIEKFEYKEIDWSGIHRDEAEEQHEKRRTDLQLASWGRGRITQNRKQGFPRGAWAADDLSEEI